MVALDKVGVECGEKGGVCGGEEGEVGDLDFLGRFWEVDCFVGDCGVVD